MALVVFGEQDLVPPVETLVVFPKFLFQQVLLEQFFAQPQRNGHIEGGESPRREGQIGLQKPFELEERLVVEGNVIDAAEPRSGVLQAVGNGVGREARIVFPAGEALLLGGGGDTAILDERRGAIVIEGRDAEDAHLEIKSL